MPTTTAMSVAGSRFDTARSTRMMTRHPAPTANAAPLNLPSCRPCQKSRSWAPMDSPGTENPHSLGTWLAMMVMAMPCR